MNTTEDQLKNSVYAALLGETTWLQFLDRLARASSNGKAALAVHDAASQEGYALFGGYEESAIQRYNAYYAGLNPLQPPLSAKQIGVAASDDELFPRDQLTKTEFFNDFLLATGMPHTEGVKIGKIGSQSFTLVTGSDVADAQRRQRSVRRLAALAPHLRRAFGFYRKEVQRRYSATLGIPSLMDSLDMGVIAIESGRRIRTASDTAQAILAQGAPVRVSADGRVRFRMRAAQAAFDRMLMRRYQGPSAMDFYFERMKLTLVHVSKTPEALYFEGATVLALLERWNAPSTRYDPRHLTHTYGLSRGEARALAGIIAGQSVDRIAVEASVSRETIRSQIKGLYAKTGARSQADILRLVYGDFRVG